MTHQKAYCKVRAAIKSGILIRPDTCPRCGREGRGGDGRTLIHAHHHDYSKPLEVEWLCAKCHRAETPLPAVIGAPCYGDKNGMRKHPEAISGSKNGWSKLTECQVSEIKALRGHVSVKTIAERFGVKPAAIYDILSGRNWKHIAAAPKEGRE